MALQSPTYHEHSIEVIEVGSMSSNVPQEVRKKALIAEDIRTQMQSKYELKDGTINLIMLLKIIMEQIDLSRGFEDTTLSPHKFTPVSEKSIQVLNVSNKHWILVFRVKFWQINTCDSLVTDRKYPKNVIKSITRITKCHGSVLELRILLIQQQKKFY